ncbi:acyltransferase [Aureimonas flava]|uniref:Acyltransferase n=1 Tax=Aureimonas flava TaxID=2320271 RepID=A0A3A1WMU1_9HYPH|nr:acyltransferase [Aureimonas flava]RIY01317.1 acyltransferase [Aureimonas flava]
MPADVRPVQDRPGGEVETAHAPVFQRRARNRNLQWLRAVAALFVVLFHASQYMILEFGDHRFTDIFGQRFGILGVAIFFAISGALMADILKTTPAPQFLIHRILRIYPMLLIASLVLPVALLGDAGIDLRALSLVAIGQNGNYRLAVEWTLVFELFFYVALFLVAVAGLTRRLEGIALVALALSIGGTLAEPDTQARIAVKFVEIPFMSASAAFAGGLLVPWLVRRNVFHPALAGIAVAAAIAIPGTGAVGAGRLLAAVTAVILVGLAISLESDRPGRTPLQSVATRFGDWSYALYLCHMSVLRFTYDHLPLTGGAAFAAAVAGSILLSIPLGMLDLRLYAWLRRRSDRSTPESFRRWAWIYVGTYAIVAVVFLFKT